MDISYLDSLRESNQIFLEMSLRNITKQKRENEKISSDFLIDKETDESGDVSSSVLLVEKEMKKVGEELPLYKNLFLLEGKPQSGDLYWRLNKDYSNIVLSFPKNKLQLNLLKTNIDDIIEVILENPSTFDYDQLKPLFKYLDTFKNNLRSYEEFFKFGGDNDPRVPVNDDTTDKILHGVNVAFTNKKLTNIGILNKNVYDMLIYIFEISKMVVKQLEKIRIIGKRYGRKKVSINI